MSASTNKRPVGDNRAKAKSISGWKAFDLKQRRKQQGLESDNYSESYPSLSGLIAPQILFTNDGRKPFSSVVVDSTSFPSLTDVKKCNFQGQEPASSSCLATVHNAEATDTIVAYQKLNYLHPWADKSLIRDVLASVNNNVDEALSLMEAMLICEDEDDKNKEVESYGNYLASFDIRDIPLGEKEGISSSNDNLDDSYKQSRDVASSIQLLDAAKSSPIISEPEWEEDDVYLIHRKDAIRMIRSASRLSKAANGAYIGGDHTAARHFSLKAQQEWGAAESLNAKAAKQILNLRNCRNDLWTLDLHGLHAKEAVEALRERLQTIELQVSSNCLTMQNGIQKESGMLLAPSVPSSSRFGMEKVGRLQQQASRQRITLLQVITGKGNHSRGAAALPSAVRNFLNEKGYRFDETRPGVIMIRPKFRHR